MLVAHNGLALTYDANGCLLSKQNATVTTNYNWTRGKLSSISSGSLPFGLNSHSYTYDAYGRRTQKTQNMRSLSGGMPTQITINTTYDYDCKGRLIRENVLSNYSVGNIITTEIVYLYDESGVIGMVYTADSTSSTYYFNRNIQGDIVSIYDTNETKVVEYLYDAYGNCSIVSTSNSTVANANPFRYRGYYFDRETGLYFLNSRYYSPELRRFISPANVSALNPKAVNGLNLYCYVGNNPIGFPYKIGFTDNTKSNAIDVLTIANTSVFSNDNYNKNYLNVHWKNDWFNTDWLGFLVLSREGFEVANWEFSICKASLFFDNNKNHSIYVSTGNIIVYVGINYKEGIGIDVGANVLEIGYDGRVVDISIEGLTIGFTYMYKKGTFTFGVGYGWYSWSISIDLVELFEVLFGG